MDLTGKMQLKSSCRLCLSKEGNFHILFAAAQDGWKLADELSSLLNFQIINKENLPESICSNCYKINLFFKEFKSNCVRVNDYINQLIESQKCTILDIAVKTEKTDEDVSENDTTVSNIESQASKTGAADYTEPPYPVALVTSNYNENLRELRSNFLSGQGLRPNEDTRTSESEPKNIDDPVRRGRKRIHDDHESTQGLQNDFIPQDFVLTTVKTERCSDEDSEVNVDDLGELDLEEDDIGERGVRNDTHSSDLNGAISKESVINSGSDLLNGSVGSAEPCLTVNLPDSKRAKTFQPSDVKWNAKGGNSQSSAPPCNQVNLEVKQEEIDLYDSPVEEVDDCASSNLQNSPERVDFTDSVDSDCSSSPAADEDSMCSYSNSSEESDEDTEMLILLALLM